MLAKSYQENYDIISEPFTENNKQYVNIKHKRTGNCRKARWYAETPALSSSLKVHDILGFGGDSDSIHIFTGSGATDETYLPLRKSNARFHVLWGWYVPHNEEPPQHSLLLPWSAVGNSDHTLKTKEEVEAAVDLLRKGNI